jgi:putative peptide zinc metalloprotease protein
LVCEQLQFDGEVCWVVKDPISLKYFRLRRPEWIAFEMLSGTTSYLAIKDRLTAEFPESTFRLPDVQQLVNSFHQNGLLLIDTVGQAVPLQQRRSKEVQQKAVQLLMSAMSLKFPGVDPERFLAWLYPKVSWMFSGAATFAWASVCVAALVLVAQNATEVFRRLPEFEQFFGFNNLLLMATVMIVTKSLHELGHGLMCKHYGGECHEIGFMLLVMTPAMYCNTSDSWRLPNKWHRIAIGAAGMYVEIVLAAICTFVWWYTQPGIIHYLALNTIFLCSFSTIVFNANPLLRYDGYYMLADYLEIPNMGQKSKQALTSKLRQWCLGMEPINPGLLPQRNQIAFAIYSVASFVYRWFVMLMIFWFIIQIFEPYGLEAIGHLMVAVSLIGMIAIPAWKVVKFIFYPGRTREMKTPHIFGTTVVLGLLAFGLFAVPVPHRVAASFVVEPLDAEKIYVRQPGVLHAVHAEVGSRVEAGGSIVTLVDEDLAVSVETLKVSHARVTAELENYSLQEDQLSDASRRINSATVELAEIERQLEIRQRMLDQLELKASRAGTLILPPNILESPYGESNRSLARWTGTPLDADNRNCFLEKQTLVCLVGDPHQMRARLMVDQSEAKQISAGQAVGLMFDSAPGKVYRGQVEFVSREPVTTVPRQLTHAHGGPIATKPASAEGQQVPMLPIYEASVVLVDVDSAILTGDRGTAKISVDQSPLGQRLISYFTTVINFR